MPQVRRLVPRPFLVLCLIGCLTLGVRTAAAQAALEIDLGAQKAGSKASGPIDPGTYVVEILSRLPDAKYDVAVERRVLEIDPLSMPKEIKEIKAAEAELCADLKAAIEGFPSLAKGSSEADVRKAVLRLRELAAKCPEGAGQALEQEARTRATADRLVVGAGEEVTITVTRKGSDGDLVWTKTFSTGPRGKWLTSYGFTFSPNRDENYFSQKQTDDTYKITAENDDQRLDFAPSIFFTWMPAARAARPWAWGLTGGLGFDFDNPIVFLGANLTYNWNLTLVGGLLFNKQTVIQGQYHEGQTITENLNGDQLTRKTYGPNAFLGVAFRFDSNPFAKASTTTPPKAAEKPPALPGPAPAPTPAAPAPAASKPSAGEREATTAIATASAASAEPQVWGNPATKTYFCPGTSGFHRARNGKLLSRKDAEAAGYRPAHGSPCAASSAMSQPVIDAVASSAAKIKCGKERWPVKTAVDQDRASIDYSPVEASVSELAEVSRPDVQPPQSARLAPIETTVFRVRGNLTVVKKEADGDLHLVLSDPDDPEVTMIVEVPDAACAAGSGLESRFTALRKRLKKYVGKAPGTLVEVDGVGFFDFLHHQTGVAPNGIELHPVIAFREIVE